MPSPCNGFTSPAASPTSRTRPRAGVVPTMPILSQPPEPSGACPGAGRCRRARGDRRCPRKSARSRTARAPACRSAEDPDAEADVGPPVRARGRASRSRGRPPAGPAPRSTMCGQRDGLVQVGPHGESPQHPGGRRPGRRPRRPGSWRRRRRSRRRRAPRGHGRSANPSSSAVTAQWSPARPSTGTAPAARAASRRRASKPARGTAVPYRGRSGPSKHGSRTRRPVGPTTSMSPTSGARAGGRRGRPASARPAARSGRRRPCPAGRPALSTRATRAPPGRGPGRRRCRPGPAPTTSTSKRARPRASSRSAGTVRSSHRQERRMSVRIAGDRNRFARQLFTGLPDRYDRLAEVLSMGQNGRWRRAMVDHIVAGPPGPGPRRGHGTAGVALQLARRTGGPGRRGGPDRGRCCARGRRNVGRGRPGRTASSWCWPGRAAALRRRHLRRPHLHLPAALRRRPRRPPSRELARVVRPGRDRGQPRVPRPPDPLLAVLVVALHAAGAAGRPGWLTGGREWFQVGRFLGPNISAPLPPLPGVVDGRGLARGPGSTTSGCGRMSLGGGLVMWGRKRGQAWAEAPEGPSPGAPPSTRPDPGGWRDWWTLLHPPYTAWHLSYVVIGACLAPRRQRRAAGGHAAGLLPGRRRRRPRPRRAARPAAAHPHPRRRRSSAATVVGLAGAVALGVVGVARVGWALVPFIVVGPLLVVAYNVELFGGVVHTDAGVRAGLGRVPRAHRLRGPDRHARRRPRRWWPWARSRSRRPSAA